MADASLGVATGAALTSGYPCDGYGIATADLRSASLRDDRDERAADFQQAAEKI